MDSFSKFDRLAEVLRAEMASSGPEDPHRTIIFAETKRMCDDITARLRGDRVNAMAIHGDKAQHERDRVLADFKSGRAPVLVATNVASRGIDVKNIRLVVNYDMPQDVEDYVHRIGRTGRKTKEGYNHGKSVSLMTGDDDKLAPKLMQILRDSEQPIPAQLEEMAQRASRSGGRGGGRRSWGGGRGGRGGGRRW